jgi:hypothetical protein
MSNYNRRRGPWARSETHATPATYGDINMHRIFALLLIVMVALAGSTFAAGPENVLPNGSFDTLDDAGNPEGWKHNQAGTMAVEDDGRGGKCVKLTGDGDSFAAVTGELAMQPDWNYLLVTVRMKGEGVKKGENAWDAARLSMQFANAEGAQVGGHFPVPQLPEGDCPWVQQQVILAVPNGAAKLQLWPGLLKASGTMWLDDINVYAFKDQSAALAASAAPLPEKVTFEDLPKKQILPAGWSVKTQSAAGVAGDDGQHFLRLQGVDGPSQPGVEAIYALPEGRESIGATLRARMKDFETGTVYWKHARLHLQLLDKDGSPVGPHKGAGILEDTDWTDVTIPTQSVPAEAKFAQLTIFFSGASGQLDVDDISFTD